jgi:hypothetical protein
LENYLDIEIFGEKHRFKTNLESSLAESIQDRIEKEVFKAQKQFQNIESEKNKVVVLLQVALIFAKENFELKNGELNMQTQIVERANKIIELLDKNIELTL